MIKTALITGSARRIGAEIARILHENGTNIIVHYLSSESDAEILCQELNQKRPNSALMVKADLNQVSDIHHLVELAVRAWGRLDILVNNASRFYRTTENITEKTWEDLMASNVKAPFFLAQAAYPHLKVHKGIIINIADIHGEQPLRDYSVYSISKAGLLMLTKTLAKEYAPDVRVNSVSPGAMIWPEGENTLSDEIKQKIIDRTSLKRHGSAKDIAEAVLFLVQDGSYITGQNLRVSGG